MQGMVLSHAHSKTGGHGQAENCLVNVHNQVVGRIVHSKLQACMETVLEINSICKQFSYYVICHMYRLYITCTWHAHHNYVNPLLTSCISLE